MIDEKVVHKYEHMVRRIATDYAKRYRMIDRDDIVQECWLWFLEHPNKVHDWMQMDTRDGDKLFAKSIRNAASRYCVNEKARIEGYHVDDLFWYSKDFIKDLLPAVLSEDWKRVVDGGAGGATPKPPSESGDWMAYAADVRRAYEALDEEDRMLVDLFYVQDVHGQVLMEASERPSIRAAEMAANRAVGRMVKFLGGDRPSMKEERDN